jgi:hypothetical protein
MSNEQTDQLGWNPPDGGLTLDELFPNPETAPQGQNSNAQVSVQQTQPEYFLKTGTTSYKSLEEAVRGTEEKDRTVERLKAELAQLKQQAPVAPATTLPAEDYRKTMFKRLAEAAQKGDETGYMDVLAEFQSATLAQFAPALTGVYEEQAINKVESEAKDFRQWLHSPDYTRTLEQFPRLADAIRASKSDPRLAGQLEEFYRLAYRAYAAEHVNELQAQAARSSAPAPTPTRPTLQSGTPTPIPNNLPTNNGTFSREQILTNRAARQEFLKQFRERQGAALDTRFGDVGL